MTFQRHPRNPLITTRDVTPSRPDFDVIGAFNAGVTTFEGEVLLLLRVAERPIQDGLDHLLYPALSSHGEVEVRSIARNNTDYDMSDPRLIQHPTTGETVLTSISHIRLARSQDGIHFTVDEKPWLMAQPPYENFGVEDARVTQMGDTYYINYSAVSALGISTGLVSTTDFQTITRHGVILPPANRDVTIFPQQVGGQYACYHRPMPGILGGLNIWYASSPDLRYWGEHRLVLQSQAGTWEAGRVGGSVPPIRTEQGWLSIYHAADRRDRYCLGAFLTPLDEPWRVIGRSAKPVLAPEAEYETKGFFPNVVFSCGAVVTDGILRLYYGACDEVIAAAETTVDDVLNMITH